MRGLSSLGAWLFWSTSGLGIAWLAVLTAGHSRQVGARHSAAPVALVTPPGTGAEDAASKRGIDYADGKSHVSHGVVRTAEPTADVCDDCGSADRLGRKWAEIRGFSDAADCADASSSVEFQRGCRAYAAERRSR